MPSTESGPSRPWYTLDVTERCNAECIFCPALRRTGRVSDLETVKTQIADIRRQGYGVVCFSGGEPTTHPDLAEMLRFATELGLKAAINTNGFRFASRAYLDSFRGMPFRALVSFHSHREAVFNRLMGARSFHLALRGIRNLMERGIPVNLSHVLNAFNYKDFPGWVRFVNSRFQGVDEMGLPLHHDVFFNQEVHEPAGAMVRFKEVLPYLREGLRLARFPLVHRNSCTASYCLFEKGFHRDSRNFRKETRARNLEKLKTLPLLQQKELLNYFVPERCYSCREFLAPTCKGVRKKYLLVFGWSEFKDLLNAREKSVIDGIRARPGASDTRSTEPRVPSSPYIPLGEPGRPAESSPDALAGILLGNSDHQIRREAARALGDLGPAAAGAAPALARALKDEDTQTRRNAALALSRVGAPALGELRRLLAALKDPDVQIRRHVLMALCGLQPLPRAAAAPLTAALGDEDQQVRRDSALSLAGMKPVPAKAARALALGLSDPDTQARRNCALALSRMEPPPRAAVPALTGALRDEDSQVRREVCYALCRIPPGLPPRTVGALLGAARDPDAGVRRNALQFFCRRGRSDPQAAAVLTASLRDEDPAVRQDAADALGPDRPAT